jgi:AcrR family transcriptional regulator
MMKGLHLVEIVRELPRRAHGLSRKTVTESQRWRLLGAMAEVTAKAGYLDASVTEVIAVAGVSRKTFYEYFVDKEDCFLTAYEVVSERLAESLAAIGSDRADSALKRRAQVTAYLTALSRDRALARVFIVEVLGAGPRALARREKVNGRFAELLLGTAVADPVRRKAIIGGVNDVVAGALLQNRAFPLLELIEPLSEFMRSALGLARSPPRRRRRSSTRV